MRHALLLSCVVLAGSTLLAQQAPAPAAPRPAPAQPAPAQPAPAQPRPAARRPAQATVAARTGMALTVTNPQGMPLPDVRVEINGPSDRSGTTDSSGQLRVTGLQVGTYRLRFTSDSVITFEREVAVRSGQTGTIDVTLNPAPPPPAPPPAPEPVTVAAPAGPTGKPLIQSVPDVIERNFVGTEMRRETLLSCSGNTRTMLLQLNGALPTRLYDSADATYYVVGGEGTVTIAGMESKLPLNTAVSVPRGTQHSFTRQGRRALILMSVLGGEACEEAK
jgi:hypothetical protein